MASLDAEIVLNNMSDLVFVMSVGDSNIFRYAKMNTAAMAASGLSPYAYGMTFHDVLEPSEAEFLSQQYRKAILEKNPGSFILDHEGRIGETRLNVMTSASETYVIGTVRDITERVRREHRLLREAHHDALTGVLNRHGLQETIVTYIQDAESKGMLVAIIIIDVDSLKEMNDTWGHLVGDAVLQAAARRMESVLEQQGIVARIGGDEFILAAQVSAKDGGLLLAERIRESLSSPWLENEITIAMTASMGVAMFPLHGNTVFEVIQRADRALYKAKAHPGNRYECAEF